MAKVSYRPLMAVANWKLPGYVIEERLGDGASGEVWRAHVSASGEPVALKRVMLRVPDAVRTARVEAAMLSTLDHPHLVRLHELVPTPDAMVLVLDLADAGSLAGLIARRGRLSAGEVISALSPIGAALAYAHNHGVVHGDVTPANVLFTRAGLPLLADLGVARIVGDDDPVGSTPAYLDPSVAAGFAPGAASDVFMLAAVSVHALTGKPIWPGETPAEVLVRAAAADFCDLDERLAAVPGELATLLRRGLEVQPARRCTAAQFALDLRHCGEPVVVELDAGRGADPGPPAARYAGAHRVPEPVAAGQPAFERPAFDRPAGASAQFTHSVRAALRPTLPTARRHRLAGLGRRRTAWVVVVAAALLSAVAGGVTFVRAHGSAGRQVEAVGASSPLRAISPSSAGSSSVTSTARRTTPSTATPPADTAAVALAALDAVREQAFGRNQPALLAKVYAPGPLLAQDAALLARVVPPGCALVGLRTSYSTLQTTSAGPDRLVLRVRATLAPSTLLCAGARSATASGGGPANLRIELLRSADGAYRIASQQKL